MKIVAIENNTNTSDDLRQDSLGVAQGTPDITSEGQGEEALPITDHTSATIPEDLEQGSLSVADHTAIKTSCCNNVFGRTCLETWLEDANTCPLCRVELYSAAHPNLDILE